MRCAAVETLYVALSSGGTSNYQVDSLVLGPDVIECAPGQLAIFSSVEVSQLTASPWVLTNEQGVAVSLALISVWAVAWIFRVIIRGFLGNDPDPLE